MKMVLLLIVMLNDGSLELQKIESSKILSCSSWIEKNIEYKSNPRYEEGNGEIWVYPYYKDKVIVGHICEKEEL